MPDLKRISPASFRKWILTLLTLIPVFSHAQSGQEVADTFRSNGKIYVVVLVICTIFAGIILFLVYLERKIRKLEQNQRD
jgi:uncharacterized membrane protein